MRVTRNTPGGVIVLVRAFCSLLMVLCLLPAAADTSAGSGKLVRRDIRDILVTKDGSIYVLDGGRRKVLRMDQAGTLVWSVPIIEKPGSFLSSLVLATKTPWNLLVLGYGEPLRDVSVDGKVTDLFRWIDSYGDGVAAVDGSGKIFVTNPGKNRVEIYVQNPADSPSTVPMDIQDLVMRGDRRLSCVKVIDGSAPGPTHLSKPHAVFVDYVSGRIWVLDQTYVFRVYDSSGKFLFPVKASDPKNRSFTYVRGMEFDSDGNTYVSSAEMRGILKYDKNGNLLDKAKACFKGPFAIGNERFYFSWDNRGELQPDGTLEPAQIKVYDNKGSYIRTLVIPE